MTINLLAVFTAVIVALSTAWRLDRIDNLRFYDVRRPPR